MSCCGDRKHPAQSVEIVRGDGAAQGMPGNVVDRLRNMLAYLGAVEDVEELKVPPNYGAHGLTGDRAETWALTVTRNWRLTFRIGEAGAVDDVDLEDYH